MVKIYFVSVSLIGSHRKVIVVKPFFFPKPDDLDNKNRLSCFDLEVKKASFHHPTKINPIRLVQMNSFYMAAKWLMYDVFFHVFFDKKGQKHHGKNRFCTACGSKPLVLFRRSCLKPVTF